MKVTWLPDVEPRAAARGRRHVRRRPPRPPRGDRRRRHRADVRPAPLGGRRRPNASPPLLTTLDRKAELLDGHRRRGARRHPVRQGVRLAHGAGVHRRRARRDARRHARQRGGELPLRPQGAGRHRRCSPPTSASRRASCRCWRSTARSSARRTSAGSCSAAPSCTPTACSARRSWSRARSCTATSAAASWASRPPTSCRRPATSRPATASTPAARATGRSPRSTSACARCSTTGRGELIEAYLLDFDGDLYGSELRLEFLKRLRGEKRFASVDALVEQMHLDVEEARRAVAE